MLERREVEHYVDYVEAVADLITAMPARRREIAVLHFFCGMPAAAIAARLNVKPRTVWTKLCQIRRSLRETLRSNVALPTRTAREDFAARASMKHWGQTLLLEVLASHAPEPSQYIRSACTKPPEW
jgi:hypothetical protein